jgi:dienelactone hydrolase
MNTAEEVKNTRIPLLYITVTPDDFFPEESQQAIIEEFKASGKQGGLKAFHGVPREFFFLVFANHGFINILPLLDVDGFVVRGNFADPDVKAKSDEALENTVDFILAN